MSLTAQQRQQVADKIMREISSEHEEIAILKSDVRATVDAVDDWAEANRTSYNNALPLAARNNLTAALKARFLSEVILKRFRG